jgi:hypothetical protein
MDSKASARLADIVENKIATSAAMRIPKGYRNCLL